MNGLRRSAIGVALGVLAALASGCGGVPSHRIETVPDGTRAIREELRTTIAQADDLRDQGRYEEAARAYNDAASTWLIQVSYDGVGLWTDAAVCWLAAGDTEKFIDAIDRLWINSDESARRSLDRDALTLVALADRLAGRPLRVSTVSLPPEIRSLIDSQPVPDWKLYHAEDRP